MTAVVAAAAAAAVRATAAVLVMQRHLGATASAGMAALLLL
jgi:hypothetical protein